VLRFLKTASPLTAQLAADCFTESLCVLIADQGKLWISFLYCT